MSQRYAFALSLKFNPYIITRQYFQLLNYYVFLKYLRIPAFMKRPPIYFKTRHFFENTQSSGKYRKKAIFPKRKRLERRTFLFLATFLQNI